MDMAIVNLDIFDRDDMIYKLQSLSTALKQWPFKITVKAIPTASIPVIKVKVDLESLRESVPEF